MPIGGNRGAEEAAEEMGSPCEAIGERGAPRRPWEATQEMGGETHRWPQPGSRAGDTDTCPSHPRAGLEGSVHVPLTVSCSVPL